MKWLSYFLYIRNIIIYRFVSQRIFQNRNKIIAVLIFISLFFLNSFEINRAFALKQAFFHHTASDKSNDGSKSSTKETKPNDKKKPKLDNIERSGI